MPRCWHCHAETPAEHYERIVYGKEALHGPWEGWRLAGRYIVGPHGNRITPERLRGLLWAEANRRPQPQNANRSHPAAVIRLPARERFEGAS